MRAILIIIFIVSNFTTMFSQETELFKMVNQYRVANRLKPIVWSDELNVISVEQLGKVIEKDSLFHSKKNVYECVTKGINIAGLTKTREEFNVFCIKYFKTEYNPNDPNIDLIRLMNMYIIYKFHISPPHKGILLRSDVTKGSAQSINIEDFIFQVACPTFKGATTVCQTVISDNYMTKFYGIVNLK